MSKKVWIPLLILAVLLVGYYALFMQAPKVEQSNYEIQLDQMRKLTDGDQLPEAINSLIIAEGSFPSAAVVAGESLFSKSPLVFSSFQIQYGDGKTIILDTAHDKRLQEENFSGNPFYQDQFDKMQAAMLKADSIIATHEHVDHVGGIAQSPNLDKIEAKVHLTEEQINGPTIEAAEFPKGSLEKLSALKYDTIDHFAPGIVLQKAPGHSVGSQLVYVRLKNGHEFLFIGDVAWSMRNIDERVGRPGLISWFFLHENRDQVANQLTALNKFKKDHPEVQIVIAHDPANLEEIRKDQGVGSDFQ
ncbi:MAG: MBL fold metallo-hydrolase [Leptospiraceae bacterium]|nr:MBL fold metallo-hydrolase [Leptospiraceae bacterium]